MLHIFVNNTNDYIGSYHDESKNPNVLLSRNDLYGVIAANSIPAGTPHYSVSCDPNTAIITYDASGAAGFIALQNISALGITPLFLIVDSLLQIVLDRHGSDIGLSTRIQGIINGLSTYVLPTVVVDENSNFSSIGSNIGGIAAAYAALPAPDIQTIQGVLQ